MNLHIQAVDHCDSEQLRALLIDAADQLAGDGCRLLESKLPWDGHPILLADADARPVLISFDLHDSQAALVSGLHASDQLSVALPWVNQVYPALDQQQKKPRLMVITAEPPPGYQAVLRGDQMLRLFTAKVLRVNENMGLLLEALDRETVANPADAIASGPRPLAHAVASPTTVDETNEAQLSEQEAAYFQQL